MQRDILTFVRSWAAQPLRVGAIAPSGGTLAHLMTRDITPATGHIIELGPGTGVFTARLLARGVRPENLTLIEYGGEFTALLERRFPRVAVLHMDAARLARVPFDANGAAGAVISGLPLLNMPVRQVLRILDGSFKRLTPEGAFYQFTYSPRCPVPRRILDRLGLRSSLIGRTILNVPPASVYRLSRRAP